MNTQLSRRLLLGSVGTGLALSACSRSQTSAPVEGASSASAAVGQAAKGQAIPQRPLGKTGVMVSMVGLGGAHIGKQKDPQESVTIIRTALDRGINFLDNCWDYNDGQSEERMGRALQDGYRQKAFLMTKLDGRSKKVATEQLEQSLRRLRTDMIDLVQIHEVIRDSDPAACFREGGCIEALIEAKKAGKLRFIGFTGHKDPAIHLAMLKAADEHRFEFDAVQMPLNVMDAHFRSFEHQVLPRLVERKIGVLGMKSMGSGDILESKVVSPIECLHYAMNLPTSVVITGCDSVAILEQALKAAVDFRPLPPAQVAALLERTRAAAQEGKHEKFKTSDKYDGTEKHPHWLTEARL